MNVKSLVSGKYSFAILLSGIFLLSASPALFAQYVEPPPAAETVKQAAEAAATVEQTDPGLQIAVDGSSLEAFEASMAKIKEVASEANYISLQGAIEYLLVYDMGAGRDKAKLAKNLDGKTGEQILSLVDWRN